MESSEGFGICLCGLNGSGKTTLGRELAKVLGFRHLDAEDYFFLPAEIPYSCPRPREEALTLLLADMRKTPRFVLSVVQGDMGEAITSMYRLVVYLDVPRGERMARVKRRAMNLFGDRMLPGGDLYDQEQAFLRFVAGRSADGIETWLQTLSCGILRLNGAESIDSNIERIRSCMNAC